MSRQLLQQRAIFRKFVASSRRVPAQTCLARRLQARLQSPRNEPQAERRIDRRVAARKTKAPNTGVPPGHHRLLPVARLAYICATKDYRELTLSRRRAAPPAQGCHWPSPGQGAALPPARSRLARRPSAHSSPCLHVTTMTVGAIHVGG